MSIIASSRVSLTHALGGAAAAGQRQLAFTCEPQTQSQWCWAAVATSVARYYTPSTHWTQCQVASAELSTASCCSSGGACDTPWYLERALARVGHSDGVRPAPSTFTQLVAEIDSGEPLGVRIGWRGGGGHFIVVEGYSVSDEMVQIEDPLEGPTQMTYRALHDDYGGSGAWTHSYPTRR
jgi:Papain-like cysteine protease AvrRpt2